MHGLGVGLILDVGQNTLTVHFCIAFICCFWASWCHCYCWTFSNLVRFESPGLFSAKANNYHYEPSVAFSPEQDVIGGRSISLSPPTSTAQLACTIAFLRLLFHLLLPWSTAEASKHTNLPAQKRAAPNRNMIGTSLPEYLFVRASIFALRAITPLSIFFVSFSIAEPPSTTGRKLLLTWCGLETAFWLLVYLPRKRGLQKPAQHPPLLDREERKELYWKCWDKIPNPEYFLSKWCRDARSQDVKRENVKDFYRWAMLNKGDRREGEIRSEEVETLEREEEELNEYADGVQTLLGRSLEPGRGKAKCLRLTVDEVRMLHRPLVWYMVCNHRIWSSPF